MLERVGRFGGAGMAVEAVGNLRGVGKYWVVGLVD
jgi:hypothetical protein